MLKIKEIKNLKNWDDFLDTQLNVLFTQYSRYGKFYQEMGEKFWVIGIFDDNKLVGGALVVSVHAKRGNFLFVPYGPIIDWNNQKISKALLFYLGKIARKYKYDFLRISPFVKNNKKYWKVFLDNNFRRAPIHMLAETTWLLNLDKSDDELLAEMKKNHRNLIRRCLREGVIIKKTNRKKALDRLNNLHDITAQRHKFHRFSRNYIEKEFNNFKYDDEAVIFEAYLPDGRLDSSAIIMFRGSMGAYRHSASLGLDKKLPTSYLIQWEVIKEAKKREKKMYNFWGIAPEGSDKNHPFTGITHFKKGFGGFQKDLLPCQDLPISWKYWLNYIIEKIRKIKRGF